MAKEMSMEQFAKELLRLEKVAVNNIEKKVTIIAEDLASASQRLAPLVEGGLMENATVEPAKNNGKEIIAKVGYNKKYALVRHEGFYNLGETSRRKSGFDGMSVGRKFLGNPVTVYSDKYMQFIMDAMIASGKS
ncbi:hypothetical protein ACM26V_16840 [Salipaludibacillus sp. HK11]|uniref:hypothetical protein n=1 Tax=Salipaludibacillus sp. HK11 TaxID=3394320 RepID=UPI0039FD50B1